MSPKLRDQLLQQLASLPEEQQERVLAFAKTLAPAPNGMSGKSLLKFSGTIGHSDLHLITAVIEQGCEGRQ